MSESIRRFNGDNALAYFYRGLVYFEGNEYNFAIQDFTEAIYLNRGNPILYYYRSLAYEMLRGKYSLFQDYLITPLHEKRFVIQDYLTIGYLIDNFPIDIINDPKNSIAYHFLLEGLVNNRIGWQYLFIEDYTQAINSDPNEPITYYLRGLAYERIGKKNLAINDYIKITHFNLKDDLRYLGPLVYAKLKGEKDFATQNSNEDSLLNAKEYLQRGLIHEITGGEDLAINDYTKAIHFDPNNDKAYHNRGRIYLKKNKYILAIRDFSEVIRLDPEKAAAYYLRSLAYKGVDERDIAIQDSDKAYALTMIKRMDMEQLSSKTFH